jgi:DNA-binding GntR family transcriptional regulator
MNKKMAELAQYKQIYETLRKQMADGIYTPGDKLPSEYTLCTTYQVARLTARKALGQLDSEGFIIRRQGKRSVVKGTPKGIGILSITSTTSALSHSRLSTQIICEPELRDWTEAFSFSLEEKEQAAGCLYFERLRLLDDVPVFFDITMLPNIQLPRFLQYDLTDRSLFDFLRTQYQIVVTGGTQQLFAIRADKRLQDYLTVHGGHPILQLNRKIETNRPGFHIYSRIFCVTQKYGLTGRF